MPRAKLMLIANENRGGYPSMKKRADADESMKNGTRTPGLVARLMGLESMPDTYHEKPRKALDSGSCRVRDVSEDFSRLDRDLCHEVSGHAKPDSRPQKLQKTGEFCERRSAGAGRSSAVVLPRKQQHKLARPVKSPRLLSNGNQARLMQAAAKILEPALQSRSGRRSLLDSERMVSEAAIEFGSKDPQNGSFVGSCRSCGGVADISQLRCGAREPSGPKFCIASSLPSIEAKFEAHGIDRDSTEREYLTVRNPIKCKHLKEMIPRAASKSAKTLRKAELSASRDNAVHGSRLRSRRPNDNDANEFMGSKIFSAVKKKPNSFAQLKPVSKSAEGNISEKDSIRKRRSNCNLQTGNGTASNPNLIKQRSIQSDIINKKESRPGFGYTVNRNSVSKELQKTVNLDTFGSKDTSIVSFTFSSPIKHSSPPSVKEATSGKCDAQTKQTNNTFQPKRLVLNANTDILPSHRRKSSLRGDELSSLLEEKIRELNSLGQGELGVRDTSGRTTVSILKELISALTSGESTVQSNHDDVESEVSTLKDNFDDGLATLHPKNSKRNHSFGINQTFQVQSNAFNAASAVSDSDHPSPISIFDASFSCESCSVGSFNGSTDLKESKTLAHKCNGTQPLDLDFELLDSATSVSSCTGIDPTTLVIQSTVRFSDETISNAKLLLESILLDSENTLHSSVNSFLCDIFTSISAAFFARMKSNLSLSEAKILNNLKGFLFDCLMESLDSRFNHFSMSGYKIWLKLPVLLSKEKLLKDIEEEIGSLMEMAGKCLDGLAEQELGSSAVSWSAFEAEASETGMEMEGSILQDLVDEMVSDLRVTSILSSAFN